SASPPTSRALSPIQLPAITRRLRLRPSPPRNLRQRLRRHRLTVRISPAPGKVSHKAVKVRGQNKNANSRERSSSRTKATKRLPQPLCSSISLRIRLLKLATPCSSAQQRAVSKSTRAKRRN